MPNTLVVCHDAGAAMLLTHWLKDEQSGYLCAIYGPAKEIFKRQSIEVSHEELEVLLQIHEFERIITGTGWMTKIEVSAIKYAVTHNIYCISVLDHWVNYNERFLLKGHYYYPNEIWVADNYAYQQAVSIFNDSIRIRQRSSAIEEMANKLIKSQITENPRNKDPDKVKRVLITMEPIRKTWDIKKTKYKPEIEALLWLKENLKELDSYLGLNYQCEFYLRPHPSEGREKYHNFLEELNKDTPYIFRYSDNADIFEDIYESDVVLGCETQALVIGLMMDKRVFSILPPWAPPCDLPHDKIIHLKNLI